jgi:hypothetical protein
VPSVPFSVGTIGLLVLGSSVSSSFNSLSIDGV